MPLSLNTLYAAALCAVRDFGPIRLRDLENVDDVAALLVAGQSLRPVLNTLRKHGLAELEEKAGEAAKYSITDRGRRHLINLATGNAVELPVAAARESRNTGTYTGEAPTAVRPGAMDAFALPSLNNGTRTERVRPACIGVPISSTRVTRTFFPE